MGMKKASYRLRSLSPVLIHSTAGMETASSGVRSKADLVTGKEEAEQGAYRGPDQELRFPSLWVRSSMYGAASGRKIGKLTASRIRLHRSIGIDQGPSDSILGGHGRMTIRKYVIRLFGVEVLSLTVGKTE